MIQGWARLPCRLGELAGLQVGQGCTGLDKLAPHAQALEEVDSFRERGVGGGEVAAQGVEASIEALDLSDEAPILIAINSVHNS
jgi:hypothetical protein